MSYSRCVWLTAGVGVLLALPYLGLGFVPNDLAALSVIEGWYPEMDQPFNLYESFFELPSTQWWRSPQTRIAFWRPLSSALMRLDHAFFGRWALFYHLHSLLWLGALIVLCGRLYARLPRRLAILALALYAVDESLIRPSSWICNRHTLVSVVPALAGLLAHRRWRDEGWRPGLPLSLAGFAVGLLGGETALSVLAYALAYELFSLSPQVGRSSRLRGLVPMAVLAVGYFAAYKAMGYGPTGNSFYLDPVGEPIALLRALGHLPALLATALVGFPGWLWWWPNLRPIPIGLGVGAVVGVALVLWRRRSGLGAVGREFRWLLPGALGALLPATLAFPDGRLVAVSMIGLMPLIAWFFDLGWRRWRRGRAGSRLRRLGAGALVLVVFLLHFLLPLAMRFYSRYEDHFFGEFYGHLAAQLPLAEDGRGEPQLILANSPGQNVLIYFLLTIDYHGRRVAPSWHVLSEAPHECRLWRTGSRTLELEVIDGQMLASEGEQMIRSPKERFAPGDVVTTDLFRVEILAVNERGPTRVAYHFDRDIDDSSLVFLLWGEEGLQPTDPPSVGGCLTLTHDSAPWEILARESEEQTDPTHRGRGGRRRSRG